MFERRNREKDDRRFGKVRLVMKRGVKSKHVRRGIGSRNGISGRPGGVGF